MAEYRCGEKLKAKRISKDQLEIEIGSEKARVFTEDLACIVREELPEDRAQFLFSEIQERSIKRGKARIALVAEKDIKKGEQICATIDINKYVGDSSGVRTTDSGIIF